MKVLLIGYGKMGREIERIALERGHTVVRRIDANDPFDLSQADVAFEFTRPAAAPDNLLRCFDAGLPVVCGTTGWYDHLPQIEAQCRERGGALFHASNFSLGVQVLFRVNRLLARMMNPLADYDVTLCETHHTAKQDAPSGTAVTLAEAIVEELDRKSSWTCDLPASPDQLEVAALRRSAAPGMHEVVWESPEDLIELRHTARSRAGFARGAVLAGEFLASRRGIYTMDDLLDF